MGEEDSVERMEAGGGVGSGRGVSLTEKMGLGSMEGKKSEGGQNVPPTLPDATRKYDAPNPSCPRKT